jgi:hypothetical protein
MVERVFDAAEAVDAAQMGKLAAQGFILLYREIKCGLPEVRFDSGIFSFLETSFSKKTFRLRNHGQNLVRSCLYFSVV